MTVRQLDRQIGTQFHERTALPAEGALAAEIQKARRLLDTRR